MATAAERIVRAAKAKVGSKAWAYATAKDDFDANTNKCNQFVYDIMVEANVRPLPAIPKYWVLSRPPLAGEWATTSVEIPGWKVVTDPQPGDVAAIAHESRNATGHVGIVVGEKRTASATATNIVINDWGFRPENKPTFRRLSS